MRGWYIRFNIYFVLILFSSKGLAQEYSFMFPIKPFQKNFLTGTMGELRPNHFHAGLDIKTDFKEGLPVYASEKGYIQRVVVKTAGYGLALYMKHPSGHTTVYGHLKQFEPNLWKYILEQQSKGETFELDLTFMPQQFSYNKGDVIGYSGNSGSSGGPHLHFEIRDSTGNYLNPLFFLPRLVEDKIPPVINKIALRTLDRNSRINGEFGRFEFPVQLTKQGYVIKDKIKAKGQIGFEVVTYDLMNGPKNLQGVNYLTLVQNFDTIYHYSLDSYSHPETYCINAHVDYEIMKKKGNWFQKCYKADGNDVSFIRYKGNGAITIDSSKAKISFRAKDAYGNISNLSFDVLADTSANLVVKRQGNIALKKSDIGTFQYELFENILKVEYKGLPPNVGILAEVFRKGKSYSLTPSYTKDNNTTVYLWDMRVTIPDSIVVCDKSLVLPYSATIPSNKPFSFSTEDCRMVFRENSLFDTLYMKHSVKDRIYYFQDIFTPVRDEIILTLKYDTVHGQKNKTAIYHYSSPKYYKFIGGNWENKDIVFKTKHLGGFGLIEDNKPPVVKPEKLNSKEVSFRISDFPSGIKDFKCYIDSTFIPMHYDYKRSLIWSEKIDKTIMFKGKLKLIVTDQMNNQTIFEKNIK